MSKHIHEIRDGCPCGECVKRSAHCHANCEEYGAWRAELDKANLDLREKRFIQSYDAHAKIHSLRYDKREYIWKK